MKMPIANGWAKGDGVGPLCRLPQCGEGEIAMKQWEMDGHRRCRRESQPEHELSGEWSLDTSPIGPQVADGGLEVPRH